MSEPAGVRLSVAAKIGLLGRIWLDYLHIRVALRRVQLPRLVERVQANSRTRDAALLEPRRLGRIVHRALKVGPIRPRCLTSSLVLLKLLAKQGTPGELVIGLPRAGESVIAHAWIEVDGAVVGPPPGSLGRRELVRYGRPISTETRGSQPDPSPR